jgi:hypothetical protein
MQEWGWKKVMVFPLLTKVYPKTKWKLLIKFWPWPKKLNEHFFIRYNLDYGFESKLFPR